MSHLPFTTPHIQSTGRIYQRTIRESQQTRLGPHRAFIHVLDDDSLLNIFFLCRPVLLDEDEANANRILEGGKWERERWWYKLTHVCQRWHHLMLASASHLGLRLLCTCGTPVADMLAHSPPLPLVLDYIHIRREVSAEDEDGILHALHHRDRVRRIRLEMPIERLQKLVMAIDDEFQTLEYLYIMPPTKHDTGLILPQTLQAPHLRHLMLRNFAFPIRSPLLTTATGLVTLSLNCIHPSAYFPPNDLLRRLYLMPQLETLGIAFHSPIPNRDIKRQLLHTPITTHVTLPNLHWFGFTGATAYLEALLPRMTTPLLEKLQIRFFNELTLSVPHLLQFITTTENLRFRSARIKFFAWGVNMSVYPDEGSRTYTFYVDVVCEHLDWQVASAAQISNALKTIFSAVEHLTLKYERPSKPSGWNNEADRARWREFLHSFSNVKALRVPNRLIRVLSRSLQSEGGDTPMELLPMLKELSYTGTEDAGDVFASFVDAREIAGRPVSVVRMEKLRS